MKGRINSMLWWLVGTNAVALILVLFLSYGAGARSGGLRLRDFGILPPIAGFELLGAAFLVVAASIVLFIWLDMKVRKPVSDLVEVSDKLAAGDAEAHAEISADDFGLIAENVNRASELLARTRSLEAINEALTGEMAEIETLFLELGRGEFGARARVASDAFAPLAQGFNLAVDALKSRLERVRAAAAEVTGGATASFTSAAANMAALSDAEQQTAATLPAAQQLAAGARQSCADAEAAAEAARRALGFAEEGSHAIRDASDGMQRIRTAMQATAVRIKSLGDRSLEIYDIINIIHETNLLALNAVLEASRGGTAQPLDTLAAEMRKLADHSRGATREIVTLLKSIQSESNEAVMVIDNANRVAESGAGLSEQASKAFSGIATLLRQTADLANAISGSSRQQVQAIDFMRGSLEAVAEGARQNAAGSRVTAAGVEKLTRLCDQLNQALAQFRTAPVAAKPEAKPEAKPQSQPEAAVAAGGA
jgi:twitching motility protein PilJ